MKPLSFLVFLILAPLALIGCDNMRDGNRMKPLEESPFFENGASSRELVENSVAQGFLREDEHLYTGLVDGEPAQTYPFEITAEDLERGRERFEIYCAVCHGRTGYGDGMAVERGFKKPTSFHEERLLEKPPGYFYKTMTEGFGVMPSAAGEVKPDDRWKIAAYIQTLQLSQNVNFENLSESEKKEVEETDEGQFEHHA